MIRSRKKAWLSMSALLLAACLVVAGCGSNNGKGGASGGAANTNEPAANQPAANTPANEPADEQPAASDLKPYTVTLRYPGSEQEDEKKVEEAMNKILTEKINATIDIQPIDWGAWEDKLNLMFSSGEKSDIVFTASWQGYGLNVAKGGFLPLDDLLKQHGKEILETLNPAFLEAAQIGGKTYAIATNKELGSHAGVIMRKDLIDKHKLDVSNVKTMADLEPLLQTIKDKEPQVTPFYVMESIMPAQFFADVDAAGDVTAPGVVSKTGTETTFKEQFEMPEFVNDVKLTHKWLKNGLVNKDAATTKTLPEEMLKAGKIFAYASPLKPGKDKEVESATGVPLIQVDITKPVVTTGDATGSMLAISKTSADPERAMMVINLLHSDKELLNLLVFGIENVHYKKVSDNVIENLDRDSYNPGNNWMMGDQFLNYLGSNEDPEKWEKFKAYNDSVVKSPVLGFLFNADPVKNELAQIANVNKQYFNAIVSGGVDPDKYIPEYLDKLKKAGSEKVIAEKQRQFDEFMAAKK